MVNFLSRDFGIGWKRAVGNVQCKVGGGGFAFLRERQAGYKAWSDFVKGLWNRLEKRGRECAVQGGRRWIRFLRERQAGYQSVVDFLSRDFGIGWKRAVGNVQCKVGGGGFAFLRESHAGYKAPPALCQEPAFESTTTKNRYRLVSVLFGGRWWIRTTEVIDDRFTVCSLWPLGKPPIYEILTCPTGDSAENRENKRYSAEYLLLYWWEVVDSNHRSHRRQIYSLFPLATRETSHMQLRFEIWSW